MLCVKLFSQPSSNFAFPLDSPYYFTANYGELRPNHFHAGMDFATGGQINLPVYAAEEGYVSRVKISSTGYGKCVYITHPNNKVTVYAHLNSFALKLDKAIKQVQCEQQSYEVEFFPNINLLSVRKGEIIGMSGNTGGSTGPHLHFEIRDKVTEVPNNPLLFLKIRDHVKPNVSHFGFYNLTDTTRPKLLKSLPVKYLYEDSLEAMSETVFLKSSILGFAFSGIDRFTEGGSPNNIFSAKLYLDNRLIYGHQLNNISFDDTRYINEYTENMSGVTYQKCFASTVYPKEFQTNCINRGRIIIKDLKFHILKLIVADEVGNERRFWLKIKINNLTFYERPSIKSDMYVNCSKIFMVKKKGVFLKISANTLFYSTPLILENTIESSGKLIILPSEAQLRIPITVGFKVPKKYLAQKKQLVLKNDKLTYVATIKNDSAYFAVKQLGWFQLSTDDANPIARVVSPLYKTKGLSQINALSFNIVDRGSGIAKYKLFLNNKWVLAEYDAKNDLLTYSFDEDTPFGSIQIRLEVEDKVGNQTLLEENFYR